MRSRWLTRRTLLQYGLAVAAAGPWALRQAHGAAAGPEDYRIVWTGQASSSTTRETASLQKPWLALGNSLVISLTATTLSVAFGTLLAYGVSRYRLLSEARMFNLLMFRMIPPIVVAIP